MRNLILAFTAAAMLAPAAAGAQPAKPAQTTNQCFYSRDWTASRPVDDHTLYARVGLRDVYRIDFKNGCPGLRSPANHLITSSHSGQICSALDLDVRVSDLQGFSSPCIATSVNKLSVAEIAALPKSATP